MPTVILYDGAFFVFCWKSNIFCTSFKQWSEEWSIKLNGFPHYQPLGYQQRFIIGQVGNYLSVSGYSLHQPLISPNLISYLVPCECLQRKGEILVKIKGPFCFIWALNPAPKIDQI